MRTTFTEVHNLDWRRLLVGVVAVSVLFLIVVSVALSIYGISR